MLTPCTRMTLLLSFSVIGMRFRCQAGKAAAAGVCARTVAPVMFGKPLLNNVLALDHVLLQK